MQRLTRPSALRLAAITAFAGCAGLLASPVVAGPMVKQPSAVQAKVTSAKDAVAAIAAAASGAGSARKAPAIGFGSSDLAARIKWVPVRHGSRTLRTLDPSSRLLLARSAAERFDLGSVGLSFQDVYGVIEAETSWVP
ncbi:MAG TPA: hypothetical protein VHL79_21675, partial [Ramlibacter sp.]|nr:hypothetical protein [Ramlibacter sp.]